MSADRGAELRDEGIERAALHSDRASSGWQERAYARFLVYVARSTEPFTTEDARMFAEARGLEPPPDARAWGAVAVRAKRAGAIVSAGFTTAANPGAHKGIKQLWRRT